MDSGNNNIKIVSKGLLSYLKRYFETNELDSDTGCPTSNQTASMGLNYDLGEKSANLRRINHLKKFNKANRKFCWQKMYRFFAYYVRIMYVLCTYFGLKNC